MKKTTNFEMRLSPWDFLNSSISMRNNINSHPLYSTISLGMSLRFFPCLLAKNWPSYGDSHDFFRICKGRRCTLGGTVAKIQEENTLRWIIYTSNSIYGWKSDGLKGLLMLRSKQSILLCPRCHAWRAEAWRSSSRKKKCTAKRWPSGNRAVEIY